MNILVSVIISAVMVLGSMFYTKEHQPKPLGANTLISALSTGTSLDDADHIIYNDNSGTPTTKKITWANATSSLKTFYDALYSPIFSTSAGLAGLLSNETGSGSAVFGTSPTITSATMTTPYINVSGTEAAGDLLYLSDNGGTLSRLAIGSSGNLLTVSGGLPAWASASSDFSFGFTRSTGLLSTASSTIYGLTVGDSLAATSTDNLVVENNASTTNLFVDRKVTINSGATFSGWASSTQYEQVTGTASGPTTQGSEASALVNCSTGKIVISCGCSITDSTAEPALRSCYPYDIDTCASVYSATANGGASTLTAYAICVNP